MCKLLLSIVFALSLSACASNPPELPQPKGKITKVNPEDVNTSDLKNKDLK